MKPPRRKPSKASSRVKWSKTSSALDDRNLEETNVTTNGDGSKTLRTNKTATAGGTKTRTGDRTRDHPNTTLPRLHHPMLTSPSPWTSTALEPLRGEDARCEGEPLKVAMHKALPKRHPTIRCAFNADKWDISPVTALNDAPKHKDESP